MKNYTVTVNFDHTGTIYACDEIDAIRSTLLISNIPYAINAKAIETGKSDGTLYLGCSASLGDEKFLFEKKIESTTR